MDRCNGHCDITEILLKTALNTIQSVYLQSRFLFNPFPHNKILDQTKLKAFADDKLNVTKMIVSALDRVENIVGKRKNCLYKQFLLFP